MERERTYLLKVTGLEYMRCPSYAERMPAFVKKFSRWVEGGRVSTGRGLVLTRGLVHQGGLLTCRGLSTRGLGHDTQQCPLGAVRRVCPRTPPPVPTHSGRRRGTGSATRAWCPRGGSTCGGSGCSRWRHRRASRR